MGLENFIKAPSTVDLEGCPPPPGYPVTTSEKTYFVPKNKAGNGDSDLYIDGDIHPGETIIADHSHIYVKGKLAKGSKISLRQGFVSTYALEKGAEVIGGIALIIGNVELSRFSKNLKDPSSHHPLILYVPEAKREEIFDFAMKNFHNDASCFQEEDIEHTLSKLADAFPTIPIGVIKNGHERIPNV